jgi:NADH-quinone oxidoreductase subunit C
MPAYIDQLAARLTAVLGERARRYPSLPDEVAIDVDSEQLLEVAGILRDEPQLRFEMLMDLTAVDYLDYGRAEWRTSSATASGFSRGVNRAAPHTLAGDKRYAVVSQLLSITHNQRLRLRVWAGDTEDPMVDSLTGIWASAEWYEREAFDLFGILFRGHPDLRRILTDYGFIGHPFRKDFPLIGNVEVRYDPQLERVVYQPVSIEPRTLVPRVIRHDNRYDPALHDHPPGADLLADEPPPVPETSGVGLANERAAVPAIPGDGRA